MGVKVFSLFIIIYPTFSISTTNMPLFLWFSYREKDKKGEESGIVLHLQLLKINALYLIVSS